MGIGDHGATKLGDSALRRWGPAAAYLGACAALLRWFWHTLGPDTLSYLSISRHYVRGEWSEAVNTGWSPMISSLIAPLLAFHLPDLAAMHVVTVASGVVVLYAVRKLAEDFEIGPGWSQVVCYTAAAMTVAFALLRPGPDLLEAGLLFLYFRVVMRRDF